eukprot:Em0042g22a
MYPKQFMGTHDFSKRGDHVALSANVQGHQLFAVGWLDGKRKDLVSTCGTTLPNVHDHMRQGILKLEQHWLTRNWVYRVLSTLFGVIVTDCYYASRYIHPAEMSGVDFRQVLILMNRNRFMLEMVKPFTPSNPCTLCQHMDEVQVYEFQESGYLFNEKPQPEVLDSESDSESDLTDAELETAVDNEEDSQISHSASFFPFPSKMFARLYFHLHSPRPMGETNLHFMWTTLKDARVEVPSLHQVKNFKLPDFVPPIRVLSPSNTPFYVVDFINHFSLPWKQQAVHGLAEKPTELIKWDEAAHCFIWLSSEDAYNYLKPNDLKTKAAGKKVVMLPLILFTDDLSGNKNMTECVSQQLKQLELDGIEVYDSYYKESVLVIAPLLCIICDNPRASQLLNHLGGSAKKFCRFCMADRDATPQLICEERTREKSLQQIRDIQSQLTAKSKSEKSTEMHGNVCRHYQSFVGRDYKAWSQMAIFILDPYLSSGEQKVLLSISKVFYIGYCCHFEPSQAEQLRHICQEFVDNCIAHMPELARKQKTHHLLHLVDSMLDYGPSSAFSAERCESFNSMVRLQNIFGNKLSPSRDIANHFACVEHIRFICEGGLFNNNEQCGSGLCELYKTKAVQHFFNSISMKDLNCSKRIYQPGCGRKVSTKVPLESVRVDTQDLSSTTLSQPLTMNPPFEILLDFGEVHHQTVVQYRAVVSHKHEFIHSGEYVQLHTPINEFKYGQLLTTLMLTSSGATVCLVRGFEAMALADGTPLLNKFDCPLFSLSRTILSVDSTNILAAVSFVHECDEDCTFVERNMQITQEREETDMPKLVFEHNWRLNVLFCYNIYR